MANITERNGAYRIKVSCGYDMKGKQIMKSTTYTPDSGMTKKQIEKEVQRQAVLFEERCRTGQILDGSIKFHEFADEWFKIKKDELRPTTYTRYLGLLPRINAAIGNLKLDNIQPHHLKAFYANLAEEGIKECNSYSVIYDVKAHLKKKGITKAEFSRNIGVSASTLTPVLNSGSVNRKTAEKVAAAIGKPFDKLFKANGGTTLSERTIQHHHRLISAMLNTAVDWQIIFSNPCTRMKGPKISPQKPKYLDDEQAIHLIELLESEDILYRTLIKLYLFTGCRRGELLGLEWHNVDFKLNAITIDKTSLYLAGMGVFDDDTKNDTSKRTIRVSPDIMTDLKAYKLHQAQQRLMVGDKWDISNKVFTNWCGKPLHPSTVSEWFREFVRGHDLPYITLHSLRHTNATLQIASGVPLTTVANRLGHANITTTGKIYTHAIQSSDDAAVQLLDNVLLKNKQA